MQQTPLAELFPRFCELNSLGYTVSTFVTYIEFRNLRIEKYLIQSCMIDENGNQLHTTGTLYYEVDELTVMHTDLYRAIDDGVNPVSYVKYIPYEAYGAVDVESKNMDNIDCTYEYIEECVEALLAWEQRIYEERCTGK